MNDGAPALRGYALSDVTPDAIGRAGMKVIANRYLPYPRIQHPWPEQRFLVNHPR
jgi:hypothetical protein